MYCLKGEPYMMKVRAVILKCGCVCVFFNTGTSEVVWYKVLSNFGPVLDFFLSASLNRAKLWKLLMCFETSHEHFDYW